MFMIICIYVQGIGELVFVYKDWIDMSVLNTHTYRHTP